MNGLTSATNFISNQCSHVHHHHRELACAGSLRCRVSNPRPKPHLFVSVQISVTGHNTFRQSRSRRGRGNQSNCSGCARKREKERSFTLAPFAGFPNCLHNSFLLLASKQRRRIKTQQQTYGCSNSKLLHTVIIIVGRTRRTRKALDSEGDQEFPWPAVVEYEIVVGEIDKEAET